MKIISLQAENVKRLTAVTITPDGNLVQITGKNGQGKTSVLDAIWWALEGAANIQAEPIRKGAEEARIRLDLGEYVVTRTFTRKDGKRRILIALAQFPAGLSQQRLAMLAQLIRGSGTWTKYLGKLRSLKLVTGRGELRAAEELFQ